MKLLSIWAVVHTLVGCYTLKLCATTQHGLIVSMLASLFTAALALFPLWEVRQAQARAKIFAGWPEPQR